MPNCYNSENVFGIENEKNPKNYSVRSDSGLNDYEMLRNADISVCNADELVDLRNIKIKRKAALKHRTDDFIAQVGNPYLFKVDDVVVKVEFSGGKDFSEVLADAIVAETFLAG